MKVFNSHLVRSETTIIQVNVSDDQLINWYQIICFSLENIHTGLVQ